MMMLAQLAFILISLTTGGPAVAQEDGFAPPPPPPIEEDDPDFEDLEEDMMEMGDEAGRPPPPPPMPGGNGGSPPTMPNFSRGGQDFRPSGGGPSGFTNGQPPAIRFQIVDGEFWQKGQKRARGKKTR